MKELVINGLRITTTDGKHLGVSLAEDEQKSTFFPTTSLFLKKVAEIGQDENMFEELEKFLKGEK